MKEKPKAIYAPGELSRVREKLGEIDRDEAKRLIRLLGGVIGTEKSSDVALKGKQPIVRNRDFAAHNLKAKRHPSKVW